MIVQRTQPGRGLHLIISIPEANCLLAHLATGRASDRREGDLGAALAAEISQVAHDDPDYWRRYITRLDDAQTVALVNLGLVKLIDQAKRTAEVRPALRALLQETARKIGRMIDHAKPRDASNGQGRAAKPWL